MVNDGRRGPQQAAPGELERVRDLLNTWYVPNDTRTPTDTLDEVLAGWNLGADEVALLREFRDDLRAVVEGGSGRDERLNAWVGRLGVRPVVTDGRLGFAHRGGPVADLFAAVLDAVAAGRWNRLKACPDCRWVFYDNTRNASKRWCLMYAGGPDGRACGTIAKVRRHRERRGAAAGSPRPEAPRPVSTPDTVSPRTDQPTSGATRSH